jgi:hypothetical protein
LHVHSLPALCLKLNQDLKAFEFNGKTALVEGKNRETGRWIIRVNGHDGRTFAVKPTNMRLITSTSATFGNKNAAVEREFLSPSLFLSSSLPLSSSPIVLRFRSGFLLF